MLGLFLATSVSLSEKRKEAKSIIDKRGCGGKK
jgi:hypothetical protein